MRERRVPIVVLMAWTRRSITRPLTAVVLLTSGTILMVAAAAAATMDLGAGLFVMMFGASTVLLTCATWLASKRLISSPILGLAKTVQELSAFQDCSGRVTKRSNDELGLLVDNLNELLENVHERDQVGDQVRDQRLREADQRLEALNAEVAKRNEELRESTEKLEAATTQATSARKSKSQFTANITHELRTPMNGVFGMAELLLETDLTPRQQKYTRAVLDSAGDLLSIVNNILDYSKVDAGKFERVDNAPFSPKECVERVLELQAARAQQEGLEVSYECADDLPNAMLGDGKRVRQVLTNLIGNAIKFTDRGKIVVRTSLVEHRPNASTIRFEVADTGIGIPSYLHKDIFEGFLQADTSTSRQFGGTGLGLAISKHLVGLMGGEIGVVSRPGAGSNFWFTVQGELHLPEKADLDLGGVRALVVAAASVTRDALRDQLSACGCAAVIVPGAEEALAGLRAKVEEGPPFDVVLIDPQGLDMPALVGEIRADEASKALPLVLVSTVGRDKEALAKEGLDGLLTKPVRQEELFSCVAAVTGRSTVSVPPGTEAGSHVPMAVAGARILLAEDNRVNREVAKTRLEHLKCRVDVVVNGVEAVEAVQREEYDLVLLDCEMPQLDGYGATRQIRDLEQQGKVKTGGREGDLGHLPIVALTAHTSPADRARGLESGMDDYVNKPFTIRQLREAIGQWVGGGVESATQPLSPASAHPEGSPLDESLISQAALKETLELDRLSGGGVFARVVRIFLDETPITLEDLRTAVRDGDAPNIARAAHALKSASLNVGAESMSVLCKELEALGKSGTTDGAASLATRLDELYLAVKATLEMWLEQNQRDDVACV